MPTKLLKITKSKNKDKKLDAIFMHNGKEKKVSFGQKGASDFTKHQNTDRKNLYLNRHKKRENWNDPVSRGTLSRYILWNKPSIQKSTQDFKKRFNL